MNTIHARANCDKSRRQVGASLIDLVIGVAIGMLAMIFISNVMAELVAGRAAHKEGGRLAEAAGALQHLLDQHGAEIVANGAVAGFANVFAPTALEMKAMGYLPQYLNTSLPSGGSIQLLVRKNANNDLTGLACDNQPVMRKGTPSAIQAAKIVRAANGYGLMTSPVDPNTLNGPGMQNVLSPISATTIVCAWAYLPSPL